MLQPEACTSLRSVLLCLEAVFYIDAKQTTMGLVFYTPTFQHSATEHKYEVALRQLASYAYKDYSQYHIEH